MKSILLNVEEENRLLKEHIKVLEEGGDCAEITETFWNIHNKEMEEERQRHIEKYKILEKDHRQVFEEKEIYELCFHTFAHLDMIYENKGIDGIIHQIGEDIKKRWSGENQKKKYYHIKEGKRVPYVFHKLYPIALTMAFKLARDTHNIEVPLDYDGNLEFYDEQEALELIRGLLENHNNTYHNLNGDINFVINYDDDDDISELIDAIDNEIEGTEIDYHYPPNLNEGGNKLYIFTGLDKFV